MPAFIVFGDSFLVRRRVTALEAEHGAEALLDANRHRMQGGQLNPPELLGVCQAIPFMDPLRLVVVDGLLATAESRSGGGSGRGRGRRGGNASDGWQPLADAIPQMPDTTLLLLSDGPLSASNPLLRQLRPVCNVEEHTAPRGEQLARWIKETAEDKGAAVSPAAIRSLADLVGGDLWTLDGELEKLSLYAAGREINEADVRLMVSQVREASIFEAVDAMIDGRPEAALRLLAQLRDDGREPLYIIAMVERQLRLLALARDSMDRRLPPEELKRALGTSSDFVVRKTTDQARRHTRQDIAWRYDRLLEADLAIKQGRLEPDLALELLVGEAAPRR
jgi:DNA polymerase-3 subunit delta